MSTRSRPRARGERGGGLGAPPGCGSGVHAASATSGAESEMPPVTAAPRLKKVRRFTFRLLI
jgi:hypothetical protein